MTWLLGDLADLSVRKACCGQSSRLACTRLRLQGSPMPEPTMPAALLPPARVA